MSRVLVLSSWVSVGHVGLSAITPVLQALGHQVTALPTVLLSNHPGWPRFASSPVDPGRIAAMIDALGANGWLQSHDAVLTGYLPTTGHVDLACGLIERVRRTAPAPRVVVDPVLGDWPKGVYIEETVAAAIRDRLVPLADVLTPNLFELGWLTDRRTTRLDETLAAATDLARPDTRIIVTSAPVSDTETGVLSVGSDGASLYRTPLISDVPHGVGDVFSGLIAAGCTVDTGLGQLQALVRASSGSPHLRIVEAADSWKHGTIVKGEPYPPRPEE